MDRALEILILKAIEIIKREKAKEVSNDTFTIFNNNK